ncbi:hypothetical protein [Chromobacterium subtsugae]|uniref:hypothetical protein n=1 Tax=Chromobacterium subtsugae TaxID=251747 RepID=UPI0007F8B4F2|nr:hypothetical protein [Chromobacterium subtsugae]OBU85286.1 hypothetical protein MY55_17470 [Chromobacterium subtsugae]
MVFECDSGRGRIDIEKSWLSLDDKGRHYLLEWAEIHDIDFCYGSRASKPRLIIELKKAATPKLQPPEARQIEILAMGCKVDAQYICQVLRAFLVEHGQTQRADKAV